MSCARSKGTKGIEREGKRNKDESLLLNTSTYSRWKRNTERNEATVSGGASCIRHVEGWRGIEEGWLIRTNRMDDRVVSVRIKDQWLKRKHRSEDWDGEWREKQNKEGVEGGNESGIHAQHKLRTSTKGTKRNKGNWGSQNGVREMQRKRDCYSREGRRK